MATSGSLLGLWINMLAPTNALTTWEILII